MALFNENANLPSRRRLQFKVHMPRTPSDPAEFARFVASLNDQFGRVADALSKVPPAINPDDFVRADDLANQVQAIIDQNAALATSTGAGNVFEEGGSGGTATSGGGTAGGGGGTGTPFDPDSLFILSNDLMLMGG